MNRLKKLLAAGIRPKRTPFYTYERDAIARRVGLGLRSVSYDRLRYRRIVKLLKIMTTHNRGADYSAQLRARNLFLADSRD